MATINGNQGGGVIDLGDIQSEDHTKDSGIFSQPLPRHNSSAVILLDLFGCSKSITVNGIFQGTIAEQRTFIAAIEAINNGTQVSSTFVSSLVTSPASYNVFITTFQWVKNSADPNKIGYTLTLLEGAGVD